ncbi:hypothetical protein HYV69_00285 [Candidatus Uhrbacteria bacterium]|nr:hypothetical protein [Candidatus Uhrbacteria bacterium]
MREQPREHEVQESEAKDALDKLMAIPPSDQVRFFEELGASPEKVREILEKIEAEREAREG